MKLIIAKGTSFDDSAPKLKKVECDLFKNQSFSHTPNLDNAKECYFFLNEDHSLNIQESALAHGENISELLIRVLNQLLKDRYSNLKWNKISIKPLACSSDNFQFSIWNFGKWNRFDDRSENCKAIIPPLQKGSTLAVSHILWGQQLGIGIFSGDDSTLLEFLMSKLRDRLQNIPDIYEYSENYLHSL